MAFEETEEDYITKLRRELTDLRHDRDNWQRAYEDAFWALKDLNECCDEEIAEYTPPEQTQRVLGLNGKVHSVNGREVRQPATMSEKMR